MNKEQAALTSRTARILMKPDTNPNDFGWALIYVQTETPIPSLWRNRFYDELVSQDQDYRKELEESVKWFGVRFV